jgi:hypothetical protein
MNNDIVGIMINFAPPLRLESVLNQKEIKGKMAALTILLADSESEFFTLRIETQEDHDTGLVEDIRADSLDVIEGSEPVFMIPEPTDFAAALDMILNVQPELLSQYLVRQSAE